MTDTTATPPTVAVHPVVQSVVNSVYADPNVAPENAAYVAASVLNGLAQYAPAVLTLTRASAASAGWVGLGIGALSVIIQAFMPHPALAAQTQGAGPPTAQAPQ
jgi:hypothetical protein